MLRVNGTDVSFPDILVRGADGRQRVKVPTDKPMAVELRTPKITYAGAEWAFAGWTIGRQPPTKAGEALTYQQQQIADQAFRLDPRAWEGLQEVRATFSIVSPDSTPVDYQLSAVADPNVPGQPSYSVEPMEVPPTAVRIDGNEVELDTKGDSSQRGPLAGWVTLTVDATDFTVYDRQYVFGGWYIEDLDGQQSYVESPTLNWQVQPGVSVTATYNIRPVTPSGWDVLVHDGPLGWWDERAAPWLTSWLPRP